MVIFILPIALKLSSPWPVKLVCGYGSSDYLYALCLAMLSPVVFDVQITLNFVELEICDSNPIPD